MYISQPEIPASRAIREGFMIHAQLMQDSSPKVIDGRSIFHSMQTDLISSPIRRPTFDTATRQPHTKAVGIVVTTIGTFCVRCPAELASPDNERFIEQATLLEVTDQSGDRLIDLLSHISMATFQLAVLVPRVTTLADLPRTRQTGQLNETHTPLCQPASQQALASVLGRFLNRGIKPVERTSCLGFVADIQELGYRGLHPVGDLIISNRRLDLFFTAHCPQLLTIKLLYKAHPQALPATGVARHNIR